MSHLTRTITLIGMLLIAACSTLHAPEPPQTPPLQLLPPDQGPAPRVLKQKVTLSMQGQHRQFIVLGRLTPARVKLAALLPTGQRLIYLDYDGQQLIQEALPSLDMEGRDILAVMQFALWPAASLQKIYRSAQGWALEVSPQHRQLRYQGMPRLSAAYGADQIQINDHLQGYQVTIQVIEDGN